MTKSTVQKQSVEVSTKMRLMLLIALYGNVGEGKGMGQWGQYM
jgi:hypothetical protein